MSLIGLEPLFTVCWRSFIRRAAVNSRWSSFDGALSTSVSWRQSGVMGKSFLAEKKKDFFFEKKKQKTFTHWLVAKWAA
jgi:hypothetical protein